MLKTILLVGAGSFVGGALRYAVSLLMRGLCGHGFPWPTLLVNLVGCFVFGVVFALFGKYSSTGNAWCLLLTTGVCGGFTTFSTFANESMLMMQSGNWGGFAGYVTVSVALGIALVALGYCIVK